MGAGVGARQRVGGNERALGAQGTCWAVATGVATAWLPCAACVGAFAACVGARRVCGVLRAAARARMHTVVAGLGHEGARDLDEVERGELLAQRDAHLDLVTAGDERVEQLQTER